MADSPSAQDWDKVRTAFATSIMVDTPLSSLAENLDGPMWPVKDKADTPAVYIDLTYDEATAMLAANGYPADAMTKLIDILQETLAFNDPFGDMVEQSAAAGEAENPLLKNLHKLEIPESFPIAMLNLDKGTREFCALESLGTLGEFAVFAQGMSQNVVVGGDFRELLNALSHIHEKVIAKFLPFRPGAKGLHLIEAVGMVARQLPADEKTALNAKGGEASMAVSNQVNEVVSYFKADVPELEAKLAAGTPLSSLVMVLDDQEAEILTAKLLEPHLSGAIPEKPKGFFSRLFGG